MNGDLQETSGRAVASLVCAILAWCGLCPCIGSVLAIVLGSGDPSPLARAGRILGWLHLALIALVLVVVGVVALVSLFIALIANVS